MSFTFISKKTFYSVPHIRLLSKLHSYGFHDTLQGWFKSFLIGQRQIVCIPDTGSSWHNVASGMPHGTLLDVNSSYCMSMIYLTM